MLRHNQSHKTISLSFAKSVNRHSVEDYYGISVKTFGGSVIKMIWEFIAPRVNIQPLIDIPQSSWSEECDDVGVKHEDLSTHLVDSEIDMLMQEPQTTVACSTLPTVLMIFEQNFGLKSLWGEEKSSHWVTNQFGAL